MTHLITPIDHTYSVDEIRNWPEDQPLPLVPDWGRSTYYVGAGFLPDKPAPYLVEKADRYYSTFQLIDTGHGAQIRDSLGTIHDLPGGITSLTPTTWTTPASGGLKTKTSGTKDYALLRDASGRVLFVIPGYGWDFVEQVKPFIEGLGWRLDEAIDVEIPPDQRSATVPNWGEAPVADVGEALRGPEEDPYNESRLAGDLRVDNPSKFSWHKRK